MALLLQTKFAGRGIIYVLLVLPMTMSPVIVGLMWKLFMDLWRGVCALHSLDPPMIHRDIKPQNLLIDSNDRLKISDFGSAQGIVGCTDLITNSAGTYTFMAPELMAGNRDFRGKPLDIWAIGVTLYYMLEGRSPYKSKSLIELSNEIQNEEIGLSDKYSDSLNDLFKRIFEKNPETRISISTIKNHDWLVN